MRYIRRKDNPLVVKAFGNVVEGGLGPFNTAIYEEVSGELPEGYTIEVIEPLASKLAKKFEGLLQAYKAQVSATTLKEIMALENEGQRYLRFGLNAEWKAQIQAFTPSTLQDVSLVNALKPQLLADFN